MPVLSDTPAVSSLYIRHRSEFCCSGRGLANAVTGASFLKYADDGAVGSVLQQMPIFLHACRGTPLPVRVMSREVRSCWSVLSWSTHRHPGGSQEIGMACAAQVCVRNGCAPCTGLYLNAHASGRQQHVSKRIFSQILNELGELKSCT